MTAERSERAYTADELHEGVLNAIQAHDVRAAVDILEALATVDVKRAIALYGELTDALTVTRVLGLHKPPPSPLTPPPVRKDER